MEGSSGRPRLQEKLGMLGAAAARRGLQRAMYSTVV